MKKALLLGTSCLLITALAACNLPGTTTPAAPPQMQTAAAMTVAAALSITPQASPAPQNTAESTRTPAENTSTPTSLPKGAPQITVEDVTNCRSGPGTGYERVTQIRAGQEVRIVGSYPNYWIVETKEGDCWIAMEFSTPAGDMAGVPTVTAPPTAQGGDVAAPSLQRYDWFCNSQTGEADVSLRWTDKAGNESGYRIYVNGQVFIELPANTSQYNFSFRLTGGQDASIYIEAFNEAEAGSTSPITISC